MAQSNFASRAGRILLAAAMAMTFAAAMTFIAAPQAHAATTFSKQIMKGTDRYVTYDYDFTGDGDKDKFAVKNYHISDSEYDVARVYINGVNVLSVKSQYYAYATLFRIKSGQYFLYLKTYTDSDAAISQGIYTYKKGKTPETSKMVKVLNPHIWPSSYDSKSNQYHKNCVISHSSISSIKVNENIVTIEFSNMTSIAGSMFETFNFKYKDGKLKKTTSISRAFSTPYGKKNTLTAATNFTVYEKTSSTGNTTLVKSGAKVTLLAAQIRAVDHFVAVKVKLADGTIGWITYKTLSNVKASKLHEGTLFKETMMAG